MIAFDQTGKQRTVVTALPAIARQDKDSTARGDVEPIAEHSSQPLREETESHVCRDV